MRKVSMCITLAVTFIVGAAWAVAEAKGGAQGDIKALEDRFVAAVQAKNVDAIMANYVQSPDLVVFDVVPPRQYTGWDAYKKDWEGFLGGCKDNPVFQLSDLAVEGDSRSAFGHSIQHLTCTDPKGHKVDITFRVTDGYRKVGGKWLIAHEHVSVPVDLATGKADLSSKP